MAIRNRIKELLDGMKKTRYQFWKDTGLSQNTAYRLYDDPTYVPGPSVMDKISKRYNIQPGDYVVFIPDDELEITGNNEPKLTQSQQAEKSIESKTSQQRPPTRSRSELTIITEVPKSA